MKYITLIIALVIAAIVNSAVAQFYGSQTVYCYKYDRTENDGIISRQSSPDYIFVNFQNDMMGYYNAGSNLNAIKSRLLENREYYSDQARNDLGNSYNRFLHGSPGGVIGYPQIAKIIKYCSQFSSSNKYTYRSYSKTSLLNMNMWGGGWYWSNPSWGSSCYTFSTDREVMIIWSSDRPDSLKYYKRINVNSLLPNTDFLN